MNTDEEGTVTVEFRMRPEDLIAATVQRLSKDIALLESEAFRDEPGADIEHLLLKVARTALTNALTRYYLPPGS